MDGIRPRARLEKRGLAHEVEHTRRQEEPRTDGRRETWAALEGRGRVGGSVARQGGRRGGLPAPDANGRIINLAAKGERMIERDFDARVAMCNEQRQIMLVDGRSREPEECRLLSTGCLLCTGWVGRR
jgi:hypothetical protein